MNRWIGGDTDPDVLIICTGFAMVFQPSPDAGEIGLSEK
jgi:hypothetical protein